MPVLRFVLKRSLPVLPVLGLLLAGLSACSAVPISNRAAGVDPVIAQALRNHRQGALVADADPLHLAIDGRGYFGLIDPKSGQRVFTRKGNFTTDADGVVQSPEGYLLDPVITLGPDTESVAFSEDGTVFVKTKGEAHSEPVARLTLTRFPKPEYLTPVAGRTGYFVPNSASRDPEEGQPSQNGFGLLIGGALEDLNGPTRNLPEDSCLKAPQVLTTSGPSQDLAIEGKGFFMLEHPGNGEMLFTRQGRFHVKAEGEYDDFIRPGALVSAHGYLLQGQTAAGASTATSGSDSAGPYPLPGLALTASQSLQSIDAKGTIKAREGSSERDIGRIRLAVFADESVLEPMGFARQSVYRIKVEALDGDKPGPRHFSQAFPGEGGAGTLKSGAYESCGKDIIATATAYVPKASPRP